MKSLLVDAGRYLCKVYNYHDSGVCSYKRFGILSSYMAWVWNGLILA
jgi:hypothetical protein